MLLAFVLLTLHWTAVFLFPITTNDKEVAYLKKFGYLKTSEDSSSKVEFSQEEVTKALKEFQRFNKLKQTGEFDTETLRVMKRPRCGVKDIIDESDFSSKRRKKRFDLEGSKWTLKHLTYTITKYPTRLRNRRNVQKTIDQALKIWSNVTTFRFVEKDGDRVNIDIRFERRDHGDRQPFDGAGQVLAHASYPRWGGDVHFDDEEEWTLNSDHGFNLLQVAVHEFGHSLGLNHSEELNSVMYSSYSTYDEAFQLHGDDIEAIRTLYGFSENTNIDNEPAAPPADLCRNSSVDTILYTPRGSTYVFKGEYYWEIEDQKLPDDYPRNISEDWDGLPGHLDASLSWPNGKIYFFKGARFWRFTDKLMDSNYPKPIAVAFHNIPDNLDAAFVWSANGKTYFFKGNQYWGYDVTQDPPVSDEYPRPISRWEGLPNNIDSAFQWEDRRTYFFKGENFYAYNNARNKVSNSYPKAIASHWYGC